MSDPDIDLINPSPTKRRRTDDGKDSKSISTKGRSPEEFQFTILPDPTTGLIDKEKFLSIYEAYQLIYIPLSNNRKRNILDEDDVSTPVIENTESFSWKGLSAVFNELNEKDQSSWTEEISSTKSGSGRNKLDKRCQSKNPCAFLSPGCPSSSDSPDHVHESSSGIPLKERGYCSFIVQHDKKVMQKLLKSLPMTQIPIGEQNKSDSKDQTELEGGEISNNLSIMNMKHGPCLWFFFGRNDGDHDNTSSHSQSQPLDGRPEHTDSISHDGTYHYQLSGIKEWHLKPTEEMIKMMEANHIITEEEIEFWKSDQNGAFSRSRTNIDNINDEVASTCRRKITIPCREGDVLLVNTRLWWHSTTIPVQPVETTNDCKGTKNRSVPSVSYARDIYLKDTENDCNAEDGDMTNLDGLYASNDIGAGTIIFTEEDMPDCELHRCKQNPNCEVTEIDNGLSAVISCRDIKAGEFFCILESEDDDNDDESESDIGDESLEEEVDDSNY
mmetsp:Transcript_26558/g.30889  ORF Transcript_26558/g.30889 Transcript_26558/m.30889 type:complete len:499 (-) Transcript_26558:101-1597(-)